MRYRFQADYNASVCCVGSAASAKPTRWANEFRFVVGHWAHEAVVVEGCPSNDRRVAAGAGAGRGGSVHAAAGAVAVSPNARAIGRRSCRSEEPEVALTSATGSHDYTSHSSLPDSGRIVSSTRQTVGVCDDPENRPFDDRHGRPVISPVP